MQICGSCKHYNKERLLCVYAPFMLSMCCNEPRELFIIIIANQYLHIISVCE